MFYASDKWTEETQVYLRTLRDIIYLLQNIYNMHK